MDWQLCGSGPEALQVNEEHFQKATSHPTSHMYADGGTRRQTENESAVSPAFANDTAVTVPPRGVEQSASFSENTTVSQAGGAESGAFGEETAELASLLAALTPAQRAVLLALVRAKD
jgi:hypothetical protein